jgi:hypothetical protein
MRRNLLFWTRSRKSSRSCPDLVFQGAARGLSLASADIDFFPSLGAAAVGDGDIGPQASRVSAVENHVSIVVAFRNEATTAISLRGTIIARTQGHDGSDELAMYEAMVCSLDLLGAARRAKPGDLTLDERDRFRIGSPEERR